MNGKEYCSVNERKKRQATDVAVKFDKAYLNFSREIRDIIKMVVRLTGNRTDGKIFDKSYKKHLIPFNALFKSWYKGQQKNPHLSESDESVNEGGMGILTSDQADILQGIVLRNKNKNLKGILNVALKSGHFKGVDKKELLGYIDGAKQFVKYMKSHPMESVKLTKTRIKEIIREEIQTVLTEGTRWNVGIEAVEPQGNMAKIAKIVKRKQASKLGGVMIDMQSASLLMKLYDKVSDKDKEKMNKLNAKMLTTVIKRLWSRVNLKLPV